LGSSESFLSYGYIITEFEKFFPLKNRWNVDEGTRGLRLQIAPNPEKKISESCVLARTRFEDPLCFVNAKRGDRKHGFLNLRHTRFYVLQKYRLKKD